jgi:UDP-N-acetylglucosamine 1-carboxyvinyltransferase
MDCLQIIGGKRLNGSVRVSGSKNASLPILAASILAESPVRLAGVPELADVETQLLVLAQVGVASRRLPNGHLLVETIDESRSRADHDLVSRMRASFCVLGPLLARRGRAVVSLPGGCNIGPRPVDLHLKALEALGASITISHGYVIATAKRLRGARLCMTGPHGSSVTGTANAICAAVRAEGVTTILGAAREPEITDLGCFLQALGAQVEGLGTDTIVIRGEPGFGGAAYRVMPDRIEAGTLLLAVATAGGAARIEGLIPEHLSSVLRALDATGASLEVGSNAVTIIAPDRPRAMHITALPYPGIPTDLQAPWMAMLAMACGRSFVCDGVFPQRFMHVAELCRLGARISQSGGTAAIDGRPNLTGAQVCGTDLRAAAALVLAGLAARGSTTVTGMEHLDRGYQQLEDKLTQLGAEIRRLRVATPLGNPATAVPA